MICLVQAPLAGQQPAVSEHEIKNESIAAYQQGAYGEALEGFRVLMEKYPAEALYRYYAGVCMVKLNRELDEAIELLYYASSRGVPANVNYYLGTAYQRVYDFREAEKFYTRFEERATRHELKEYDTKHLISTCRSAREITATYNPCEVVHVTFIDLGDSVQFSQVRMKGGNLQRKGAGYFQPGEERDALSSLMFMPSRPARGDYAYFSGYNRRGKDGLQLFRIRRGNAGVWSEPEEIKTLNTERDELLPYFDPIEKDLYFASDGHGGVGGLDLYRSHYDTDRDEWSEPVNMGFPINSAMDEYLLLPGSDLGMMMFFSNREGTDSTVTVYRVHVSEPKKKVPADQPAMLARIASLENAASDALADLESVREKPEAVVSMYPPAGMTGGATVTGPAGTGGRPSGTGPAREREPVAAEAYRAALAEALKNQAASDSLKDLVSATRIKVMQSDDPNDRWVWQKQIMVWEKKARDRQATADLLYARMEEIGPGPASTPPGTIRVDTVIRDITVYRFAEVPPSEGNAATGGTGTTVPVVKAPRPVAGEPGDETPGSIPRVVKDGSVREAHVQANAATTVISRFDILPSSPYDPQHPIPLDVPLPAGVFYRIQLGAYAGGVSPGAFGGLSPITGETIPERNLTKYYVGKFSRYEDASRALSGVRSAGFEDAFIVAWYHGNQISTQKAKQLE